MAIKYAFKIRTNLFCHPRLTFPFTFVILETGNTMIEATEAESEECLYANKESHKYVIYKCQKFIRRERYVNGLVFNWSKFNDLECLKFRLNKFVSLKYDTNYTN